MGDRKRAEVGENLKKVRELKTRRRRETVDFWARSGERILRAVGAARDRAKSIRRHSEIVSLLLMSKPLTQS